MKILTINIINNKDNRNNINNSLILAKKIKELDIDIIGVQELSKSFASNLLNNLAGYNRYGEYRYKLNYFFNESDSIITNKKVRESSTYKLPYKPSNIKDLIVGVKKKRLAKRLVTDIILEDKIIIFNTHLSLSMRGVQKKELAYLERLITKYKDNYKVIVMGDFNMTSDNSNFKEFVNYLKNINIMRVPIDEITHNKFSKAIDHIFIDKKFKLKDYKLIELSITDHKGIYIEID
jgi:endonuclease/exonuclease/phosphatase family metal-dependent hydrolase